MMTFYVIYFAGVIVALLLYILSLRLSIKAGLEEVPSLASELGSKEQQKKAIIMTILAHPFAYWLSWLSVLMHINGLVVHGIWRYKQRNKKRTE